MDHNTYFLVYIFIATISTLFGFFKYKTFLNVLSISIVIFSISVIIAIPHYIYFTSNTSVEFINLTILNSIVYILGLILPFIIKTKWFFHIFRKIIFLFFSDFRYRTLNYKSFVFILFLLIFVIFYSLLMINSGAGILWIISPRDAYMDYRSSSGHFYALSMWFLMFGYIYYLWFARPKYMSVTLLLLFSFLAYFLGSKGFILYFLIVFTFYWHFLVKSLKSIHLIVFGIIIFSLFLVIQLLQGTSNEFTDTIKYFIYFDTTAQFLAQFDRIGFQYGGAYLGQFWEMVPRSVYPDKPYVYGQYIIHETLDPGMLENGRARGTLKWSKYYLDFGTIGVFVVAFFSGLLKKTAYNFYLSYKNNPFAFMIMMQFGIITIFNYTNTFLFSMLLILFLICIKLVVPIISEGCL